MDMPLTPRTVAQVAPPPEAASALSETTEDSQSALAPTVTIVTAPACHYCTAAEKTLDNLAQTLTFTVRTLTVASPEGQALISEHRPPMSPLVLVDGEYFSSGPLSRRKLALALNKRGAQAPLATPGPNPGLQVAAHHCCGAR